MPVCVSVPALDSLKQFCAIGENRNAALTSFSFLRKIYNFYSFWSINLKCRPLTKCRSRQPPISPIPKAGTVVFRRADWRKPELQRVHVFSSPSQVRVLHVSSEIRVRVLLGRTRVRVRVHRSRVRIRVQVQVFVAWVRIRVPRSGNFPTLAQGIFHNIYHK